MIYAHLYFSSLAGAYISRGTYIYAVSKIERVENYSSFNPFTTLRSYTALSLLRIRAIRILMRARAMPCGAKRKGTSRNLFPRLMHDSSISLY